MPERLHGCRIPLVPRCAGFGLRFLHQHVLDALFGDGFAVHRAERLGDRLIARIVAGGFAPALKRPTAKRQADWYRDHVEALIQRDVRDMAHIRSLDILPRLLSATASQTARLFNLTDLAAPFQRYGDHLHAVPIRRLWEAS